MSLLSVPALLNKNIDIIFISGKEILFNVEDIYSTLVVADQHNGGLL